MINTSFYHFLSHQVILNPDGTITVNITMTEAPPSCIDCLYEDGDVEIEMGEDNYDIMTEANFWISLLAQSKFERME